MVVKLTFNTINEIKEYIIKQSKKALEDERDRIFNILNDFLHQYYTEFTPEYYERTYQLLQSCVRTEVVQNGDNGWKARVYFDWKNLDYSIKYFTDERWKIEDGYINPFSYSGMTSHNGSFPNNGDAYKVVESAMHGSHGGYIDGTAIWDEGIEKIKQNFRSELKTILRKNGIPIR